MLKKSITYVDFEGNTLTEDFYFNLTKAELIELELSQEGGLETTIKKITATRDNKKILELFKSIILKAYGEKSVDGRRFIKNDKIREEFEQTAAYSELFTELATNSDSAAAFFNGIIPNVPADSDKPAFMPTAPAVS